MQITAAIPCTRPDCIPVGKLKGKKAAGLRYEKQFAAHVTGSLRGQWFAYEIRGRTKYCQPDVLVSFFPQAMLVLELKYTFVPEAITKMRELYLPVVSKALKVPTVGAIVVKNLTSGWIGPITHDLSEAFEVGKTGEIPILHWVGQPI